MEPCPSPQTIKVGVSAVTDLAMLLYIVLGFNKLQKQPKLNSYSPYTYSSQNYLYLV